MSLSPAPVWQYGRLKEFITLSLIEGDSVMPFNGIVDSKQLVALTAVLDDVCRQAGLEPGSPECDDAASFVMRLYWDGHRTADELKAALLVHSEGEAKRYG
jgi:hypothetical protein